MTACDADYYQKAIDIITGEHDWRMICVALAKSNPKALCDAAGSEPWQVAVRRILESEGKVPAIKYVRNETGMGLYEAKKAVEGME